MTDSPPFLPLSRRGDDVAALVHHVDRVRLAGALGAYVMSLNVAEPKLASEGWAEPTAVGSSSIHSADAPGPA